MDKVTVIVPVYNVERYIKRCLDSLINQSYENYEIICVNDCSPDNCLEIIEKYKEKYPDKIRVISNETNVGQGRSRIYGVSQAEGEYILFVDSDDYVRNDYISVYMKAMEEQQCDVIVGGYTRDVDGKFTEYHVSDSPWCMLTYTITCAKLFRKSFILDNKLNYSEIRSGEDIYFSLCAFYYGAKYYVLDYTGYYYYKNKKSTTQTLRFNSEFEVTVTKLFDRFMETCDISKISKDKYYMIEYTYLANMINALITHGHGCRKKIMKKKYEFFMADASKRFPGYENNPYSGLFRPKGQIFKIRAGVGVTMFLKKLHLDKMLFYIVSYL